MKKFIACTLIALFLLFVGTTLFLSGGSAPATAACRPTPGTEPPASDNQSPPQSVGPWDSDALSIAQEIIRAANDLGLSGHAATIGIAAAIGESSLKNVSYGDDVYGVTNPNGTLTCSLGILQQQWCLPGHPWGTKADVMNPHTASTAFFTRLVTVAGWDTMEPTHAIHAVQRNRDPNHYTAFWSDAEDIYSALAGGSGTVCSTGSWVSPLLLETPGLMISDFYGDRPASVIGYAYKHNGVDLSTPIGTPVLAAHSGTVSRTVTTQGDSRTGLGNLIEIEGDDGITTRYHHLPTGGVLVTVGQTVTAGEQIAESGNSGSSTGPHLHFTVFTDHTTDTEHAIDPIQFLRTRGVDLCSLPIWSGHSVASTCT